METLTVASAAAATGGGIYVKGTAYATIEDNIIQRCDAWTVGGGICVMGARALIQRNLIRNYTSDNGGGVCLETPAGGESVVVNNQFVNNRTTFEDGGGLRIGTGSPVIRNNTFVGNLATKFGRGEGGAIHILDLATPTIVNNIFAMNRANIAGAAVFCESAANPAELDYNGGFDNTIDGGGDDHYADCTPGAHSAIGDPLFVNAAGGDYHLSANSPAINSGFGLDDDGSSADMGAFGGLHAITVPKIAVEQPTANGLVDGVSTISFGRVNAGEMAQRVLTIRNDGSANLTGLAASFSGGTAAVFSAGTFRTTTLAPGASTSLTVTYGPSPAGNHSTTLQIGSNDSDEAPFDIALTGRGVDAEIAVEEPLNTSLVDGLSTRDFGFADIGNSTNLTFTIRNAGTDDLGGLATSFAGANPADFGAGAFGATTLAAGATTTVTVTFTPSALGSRSAILRIASNDRDENPFDIALAGDGGAPEDAPQHMIEVTTEGGGTVSGGGTHDEDTEVAITATPAAGWQFLRWDGEVLDGEARSNNRVLANRAKSVSAIFATLVETTVVGAGTVGLEPIQVLYPYGSLIQVVAQPELGNFLALWGNAACGSFSPLTFEVTTGNPVISSLFSPIGEDEVPLDVTIVGGGTVTAAPSKMTFTVGEEVSLTATPWLGYSLLGWGGDGSGGRDDRTVTLTMTQSRSVTAIFKPDSEPVGDMNGDEEVNAFDIEGFVLALVDPDGFAAQTGRSPLVGDINGDGVLNAFDIGSFVALLTGGAPVAAEQIAPLLAMLPNTESQSVASGFRILVCQTSPSGVEIEWTSEIGRHYVVEHSSTARPESWKAVDVPVEAMDKTTMFLDSHKKRVSGANAYYRIRVLE